MTAYNISINSCAPDRIWLVVACIIWIGIANGQHTLSGKVVDEESGDPIPFVNIGIPQTNLGTAAFDDGTFQIEIPDECASNHLLFSAIGYAGEKVAIQEVSQTTAVTISLTPISVQLAEFKVSPAEMGKESQTGLKGVGNSGMQLSSATGGAAMGLVFNEDAEHIFLTGAELYIHKNQWPTFSVRCRVLKLAGGLPGEDLLMESAVVTDSIKRGKVTVNLQPYGLYVDEPIFVAFEWVVPRSLAEQYAAREANRPEWWVEGTAIADGKEIWYFNENGQVEDKQKLTDQQKNELEQYRMNTTEYAVKPSRYRGFARESSISEWKATNDDVKIRLHYRNIQRNK